VTGRGLGWPVLSASWRMRLLVIGVLAILVIGGARLRGPGSGSPPPPPSAADGGAATPGQPRPSEVLLVGVSDVHPAVTPDGSTVLSVRLVAHLRAAVAFDLATIRFVLTPPGALGTVGRVTASPAPSMTTIGTTAFGLTFDLRGLSAAPAGGAVAYVGGAPPAPGVWLLTVEVRGQAGDEQRASTPVQVVARA
jgi:hypothetical protein